jgi:hypothetical protein
MRLLVSALLPLGLLAGCAGYAIDYAKPKTSIVTPVLTQYGLDARQAGCVSDKVTASLSVWQLRQLAIAIGSVAEGDKKPGNLPRAARLAKDPKVPLELTRATEACGIADAPTAPLAPLNTTVAPATPPAPTKPAQVTWINLGAAPTGQMIAVDASSIEEVAPFRRAWFRLTNPGQQGKSSSSYLLRIDCAAKTINSMALRKHGAGGAVTEQRDYGANGEGALPIEGGTVMEIAYLALCT